MVAQPQAPRKLKSLEDVDQAMHELSWLDHEDERRNAICQQEINALKTKQADRFTVQIEGELMPLAHRRQFVEQQVAKWCDKHLATHLPEDKKSMAIAHGELGYRAQPMKVELGEGVKADDVLDKLDRKTSFKECIMDLLSKAFARHVLGNFIEIKASLSFSKILNAFKENRVQEKMLNSVGLLVTRPEDKLFIKPARYQCDANAPT